MAEEERIITPLEIREFARFLMDRAAVEGIAKALGEGLKTRVDLPEGVLLDAYKIGVVEYYSPILTQRVGGVLEHNRELVREAADLALDQARRDRENPQT